MMCVETATPRIASMSPRVTGFGASAHLHTTRLLRLSEDLPVVIEVVDEAERLRAILPELDALVGDGMHHAPARRGRRLPRDGGGPSPPAIDEDAPEG